MIENSNMAELFTDIKEHVLYLQELGVDELQVDFAGLTQKAPERELPAVEKTVVHEPAMIPELPKVLPTAKQRSGSRINALPSLGDRKKPVPSNAVSPAAIALARAEASEANSRELLAAANLPELPDSDETIEQIRHDIGNCTRCPLHEGRTKIVHTTGNFTADLMFIGEAPGADEDAKGEPFVGRAGKLLTQIIEAIGFSRETVAIGNINRCRPPGNRQPTLPEAHTCRPFLMREIAVIKPKVIVVLGNTAMHNLLDTKVGISKMRGQFHDYFNVKVMPTFHPAYLLRDPHKKREVWDDMKKVRDYLASAQPD